MQELKANERYCGRDRVYESARSDGMGWSHTDCLIFQNGFKLGGENDVGGNGRIICEADLDCL